MQDVTVDDIRQTFPEMADKAVFTDAAIAHEIIFAKTFVSRRIWGKKYTLGLLYLTAHFVYLNDQTKRGIVKPITGNITSVSTTRVSTSFSGSGSSYDNADDALLSQTQYGSRYIQLRNTITPPLYVKVL